MHLLATGTYSTRIIFEFTAAINDAISVIPKTGSLPVSVRAAR